jgi:lysophospholipase L1-like esterase
MSKTFRFVLGALLFGGVPVSAQQGDFASYVALGDSLTAGVSNGSLVVTHQAKSYPALIARQAGATNFQQPTVDEPGNPAELTLVSLLPSTLIAPKASSPGAPNNLQLPRPYNNLGVPGANTPDYLTKVTDGGGPYDIVLRGLGTAIGQAEVLRPTFITLWIGNNDVLGAVVRGQAIDGVTLTPASAFRAAFTEIVADLQTTGAKIVAANILDVTSIPFVTTIPPVVVNPTTREPILVAGQVVPLLGPDGPLPTGTFVTLAASTLLSQGVGIPASLGGTGTALPDEVILDQAEVASIRDHVNANNQAIRDVSQAAGITVLDANRIFAEIASEGRTVGGVSLTEDFLTGGLFGYDGIHPTELGYAILANEWIAAINASGSSVPVVDLLPFLGLSVSSSARQRRGPAELSPEAYQSLLQLFPRVDGR